MQTYSFLYFNRSLALAFLTLPQVSSPYSNKLRENRIESIITGRKGMRDSRMVKQGKEGRTDIKKEVRRDRQTEGKKDRQTEGQTEKGKA